MSIKNGDMLNDWVSVEDEMPECDRKVLTWDGATIDVDYVDYCVESGCEFFANLIETTHWAYIDTEETLLAQLKEKGDE